MPSDSQTTLPATTAPTSLAKPPTPPTPEQKFGRLVESLAVQELARIATTPAGKAATSRVALAFRAAVKSAQNPGAYYSADPASLASCVVFSALYNLMPGGQFAPVYLVPKGNAIQWWMNHRGIIELARRSGYRIVAKPHFDFDEFAIEYGLNPTLRHVPGKGEGSWDHLVGVYVIVYDVKSGTVLDYLDMPRSDIQARRKVGNNGVWTAWPIEMAIKTAVKYAAARGTISLDESGRHAVEDDAETAAMIETVTVDVAPTRQITSGLDAVESIVGEPSDAEKARILDAEAEGK